MRALLLVALLAVPAGADAVDDLLLRARHAQLVEEDLLRAIELYNRILERNDVGAARTAEVHLRIALCFEAVEQWDSALRHLDPRFYRGDVSKETRDKAYDAQQRIRPRLPAAAVRPDDEDRDARRKEEAQAHVERAREYLERDEEAKAFSHTQLALRLDPDNAEARALDAEVETRLSGFADFVRDPLRFVSTWTETRVTQVVRQAETHLIRAVELADGPPLRFDDAQDAFREAIAVIDASEFAQESDRLLALRAAVRARWREARARALGEDDAEPELPAVQRSPSLRAEFLSDMQRMLDVVSAPDREYRVLAVRAPRRATPGGWIARPADRRVFRGVASQWSPARFARLHIPRYVHPDSWSRAGNYLEAFGGMLVARNRPAVLDAVQAEIARLAEPQRLSIEARFLLVAVPHDKLVQIQKKFGDFEVSRRGDVPVQYRVLPSNFRLDYLCSFLRDLGTEVRPARDTFVVELANGLPQTLFAATPLSDVPAYAGFRAGTGPPLETHVGALLDLYPLRTHGRTAIALRLAARLPATPARDSTGRTVAARFRDESGELFAEIADRATLMVTGPSDPFGDPSSALVLLLRLGPEDAGTETRDPDESSPIGAEVSLRKLLVDVRDDPGPVRDDEFGFVPRERLDVLDLRARFLEEYLRTALESPDVRVDTETAVARVPPALRGAAVARVAELERESTESYVIHVHTRTVRTAMLERWIAQEEYASVRHGDLLVIHTDAPPAFVLKSLDPTESADVFTPAREWPQPTALGLQARHLFSGQVHTTPRYDAAGDLATARTRTVTEGLRLTVRPYRQRDTLYAWIELETAAVAEETEERALSTALPSYRVRTDGARAAATLEFGDVNRSRTVLVRGVPHPTRSRPERLMEVLVVLSIHPVP